MKTINIRFLYQKTKGKPEFIMLDKTPVFEQLNDLSPVEDCEIVLAGQIKPVKESKTRNQLGYYYAEVVPKFTRGMRDLGNNGFTDYDSHELIKAKWFSKEIIDYETGEMFKIPQSLSDATVDEMAEIIQNAIIFADTYLGVTINPPKK